MLKKIVKSIISSSGYEIRKQTLTQRLGYDCEYDADRAIRLIKSSTMLSRKRLVSLYDQVLFCEKNGIEGSFVECGVWKGGAVGLMALANLSHGRSRREIHLFDSFQGICEPDEKVDGQRAVKETRQWARKGGTQGNLKPLKGMYDSFGGPGTLDDNRRLLESVIGYEASKLHYHIGWFQDTLRKDARNVGKIGIFRLGADWYASTKACLDSLYDKVVSGGFIIVDDYGTYDGCRKAVDEFMQSRAIVAYLHSIDEDAKYWIKP